MIVKQLLNSCFCELFAIKVMLFKLEVYMHCICLVYVGTSFTVFIYSTIIPERLDTFINKYAEHTHDKWAFEKVIFFLEKFNIG